MSVSFFETFVCVRSKDRVSGTSSKYKVLLPNMIENVVQIEFMNAEIPNTLYTTHIRFFRFSINATDEAGIESISHIMVPVQPGIYETQDLMAFMTDNMFIAETYGITNESLDPTIAWFTFNEHTAQIGINVSNEVSQVFIDEGTDPMFGFETGEVYAPPSNPNVYYGTMIASFAVPSYVYLCIDEIQNQAFTNFMVPLNVVCPRNMIARIQMNADIFHYVVAASNGSDFCRPLAVSQPMSLSSLSISFLGPDSRPVDFQGSEHNLILKVTSKRQFRS